MSLRRPVVAWLVWLLASYAVMAVAAWTSPDPWAIGAYTRALAIMSPHWWSAVWAFVAAAALIALVLRRPAWARVALVGSIAAQLPWAVSVCWEGWHLRQPWAYIPATIVWLTPAVGSAVKLLGPLTVPDWSHVLPDER